MPGWLPASSEVFWPALPQDDTGAHCVILSVGERSFRELKTKDLLSMVKLSPCWEVLRRAGLALSHFRGSVAGTASG